jgi:heterodisulfide reductase subunit C2
MPQWKWPEKNGSSTKERMKAMQQATVAQDPETPPPRPTPLVNVAKMVQTCIQCGTCTGSCPNEFAMDITPRRLWRMVLMGDDEAIFNSKTFSLCSSCYCCTLRCPRGLPLTQAMAALKQAAAQRSSPAQKPSILFYKNFIQSVRRHGRVREMEFMTLYFVEMKNPLLPFRFASLGMRLMGKGKVHVQLPSRGTGKLAALFDKVEALEKEQNPE